MYVYIYMYIYHIYICVYIVGKLNSRSTMTRFMKGFIKDGISGESGQPACVSWQQALHKTHIQHALFPSLQRTRICFKPCTTGGFILPTQSLYIFTEYKTEWYFLLTFWLCWIVFAARCVLYVRALEVTVAARMCNYTDHTRHLRQCLPQVTLSCASGNYACIYMSFNIKRHINT